MIKKSYYTILELLVAMLIFVIMMGILTQVATTASDIATTESSKVLLLSDANIFFEHITNDLRAAEIQDIEQYKDYLNEKSNPEDDSDTNKDVGKKFYYTSSSIGFFANVDGYDTNVDGIDDFPTNSPFVHYELDSGKIVREMWDDETELTIAAAGRGSSVYDNNAAPVILDGVESLDIKLWEDYPGGAEISPQLVSSKPNHFVDTNPTCITISVTLTNPNPNMAQAVKEKNLRTVTKTIYIGR